MATLIKRDGSPFWFVAFSVPQPDGTIRRLKKSTKKKTREEAMAEVQRIVDAERKLAVATDEENRTNQAILAEANRAAARGELSEARARELLSRMLKNASGEGLQSYTVKAWSDEWLRRKAPLAKATTDRYSTSVRAFLAFLGPKADKGLEMVTKADIRDFREVVRYGKKLPALDARTKSKDHPQDFTPVRTARTANQYLADITSMFNDALTDELLSTSPTRGLKDLPEDDSVTRKPFTNKEVQKLLKKAGEPGWYELIFSPKTKNPRLRLERGHDWPGVILFGYYVGTRLRDIARLTWENIDFESEMATFVPSKTKRHLPSYQVPLHPRLVRWLKERTSPVERHGPLFPTL
ncbi:MAG: hypothetical protein H7A49_17395, partial [Akkermansiaceae bacterium]|nr:hypothetical protein [Akkermansiaceae bacterium]